MAWLLRRLRGTGTGGGAEEHPSSESWTVEDWNHLSQDQSLGKDRSRFWTGHGPANDAALNNLVLALLLRRKRVPRVPLALAPCSVRRADLLGACQATSEVPCRAGPARAAHRSRGAPAGLETCLRPPASCGGFRLADRRTGSATVVTRPELASSQETNQSQNDPVARSGRLTPGSAITNHRLRPRPNVILQEAQADGFRFSGHRLPPPRPAGLERTARPAIADPDGLIDR